MVRCTLQTVFYLLFIVVQLSAQTEWTVEQLKRISPPVVDSWKGRHTADDAGLFPVGFYIMYLNRKSPPFDDPDTVWAGRGCTPEVMSAKVENDRKQLAALHANYIVENIPPYYRREDPAAGTVDEPFETALFRETIGDIAMDFRDTHNWNAWVNNESVQRILQTCPEFLPGNEPGPDFGGLWEQWYQRVDTALQHVRSVVSSGPYATFYVAHEGDLYPDDFNRMQPDALSEWGRARRYALQHICNRWDEMGASDVKPFIVFPALDIQENEAPVAGVSHAVLHDIAETCQNLRMSAMDGYYITSYVNTTYANPPPERYGHIRNFNLGNERVSIGQREAFRRLTDALDRYRDAFMNVQSFSREDYPIELWFVGQVHQGYAPDNNDDRNQMVDDSHGAKRYPTYEELKLQAYLALSRGFKGMVWYTYASNHFAGPSPMYPGGYGGEWSPTYFGGVTSVVYEPYVNGEYLPATPVTDAFAQTDMRVTPPHPWAGCPGKRINPYDNVARINDTLRILGPILKTLEYQCTYQQYSIDEANPLHLLRADVSDVPIDPIDYNLYNMESLELSCFEREYSGGDSTDHYLMVVNKVLNSTMDSCSVDPRKEIVLTFKTGTTLVEQVTGTSIVAVSEQHSEDESSVFVVRDSVWPGEGKLYRVEQSSPVQPTASGIQLYNYPNPFSGSTTITYVLPEDSYITLRVFSVLGIQIRFIDQGTKSKGEHRISFTPGNAWASGVYFYQLRSGMGTVHGTMTVAR